MKKKRKLKAIAFTENELDLLEHLTSKGEFSSVVKQLARADMNNHEKETIVAINELNETVALLKLQMMDLSLAIKEINFKNSTAISKPLSDKSDEIPQPKFMNFADLDDL